MPDYVRQVKILRAACYFYMIDLFGDTFYADENTPVGSVPPRRPRAEVFNLVTSELEGIVSSYEPDQKPHYGFVGLDVAEALLVKFYLNAEVYTGTPMYDKCYTHAKNIIARLGKGGHQNSGLAEHYKMLFGYNNHQFALGNDANPVNEIIWTLPQDRVELNSYQGATLLILGWIGTNGVEVTVKEPRAEDYDSVEKYNEALKAYNDLKKDESTRWKTIVSNTVNGVDYSYDPSATGHIAQQWFNVGDGWKCQVARQSFVKKFEWLDGAMSRSNDKRVEFWGTSAHGFTSENPSVVGADWGKNGYIAAKFTNWYFNADGSINAAESEKIKSDVCVGGDYPMIRLAEIYLSAAEASLKGGGGSQSEALDYVNLIRTRAGLQPETAISENLVREERCRELYQECTRRTDLIRYGLWESGYNWEWKNLVEKGADLPAYTKLYPIPSRVIASSGYTQNPGY